MGALAFGGTACKVRLATPDGLAMRRPSSTVKVPVIQVRSSPRSPMGEAWMERTPWRLSVTAERANDRRNSASSKSLCRQRVPASEKLLSARPRSIAWNAFQSGYLAGEHSSSSTVGPRRGPAVSTA